jgi:hypothetical protein
MAREEDLVITPGGPRRKDLVHAVGPGDVVRFDQGKEPAVIPRKEALTTPVGKTANLAENLVLTPGGFRPRSLVHRVGPRHALRALAGRMVMINLSTDAVVDVPRASVDPQTIPALGSGWIAYAYWNNGSGLPLSTFQATWQVPPPPATPSNQTIFLFNGIENYGTDYGILQPVLQWGSSAAGGGTFWSVASWYVLSNGQAFHTQLVQVNPGDILVGVVTLTSQSGNAFSYNCEFQGVTGTSLPVQNIAELLWCNETLEAYQIDQCSDYPATTRTDFRTIDIQTGSVAPTLNWTPVNRVTDCGQQAVVVSNSSTVGEVEIYYRSASG